MDNNAINKIIDDRIKEQLKSNLFTSRKLTDTPTDNLQVVPRKYVNLNGSVASRPASVAATIGQKYFATDTKQFMIFDGTKWYNGSGSVVASN